METAFDILEVNGETEDGGVKLTGRACREITCGDVLCTETNTKFKVLKIYSFEQEWLAISAGMACTLIVQDAYENFAPLPSVKELQGQLLYSPV